MATMLAIPLKKTYEVDLKKPLKSFIQSTFTQSNPEDYKNALSEFNKLRNQMIAKSGDKHESALDVLCRYYDQLTAIENKLPITENQIRVHFKWRDAFDEGSLFAGKKSLAIASGLYEKVCVLFNIAAMQTQIACAQGLDSDEGLKTAVKFFQQASGVLAYMKDVVLSHVKQEPTPDLNPDTLNALSALMLAQAQEAIFRKAAADRMKESMVAKLSHQCSQLYADAMKLMQLASLRDMWPKDWVLLVAMKQAGFHAMAEWNQSVVAQQAKCYGEQIARLKHALDLMNSSQQRGGGVFAFRKEVGQIQTALDLIEKDNNLIYHDKVPDVKMLPAIGKAAVAKPAAFTSPLTANFTDLFEKIVPLPVFEALQAFENRKNQLVTMEVGRLREATVLINSVLSSLNLPAALEDLSGAKVPQSVLDKGRQVQEVGGITLIDSLIDGLPQLLTRNREILDESVRILDEEENSDKELREQYQEKWTRTTSQSLTVPMREEAGKYRTILDNAVQADTIVRQKYDAHKHAFDLLSKPTEELEQALPAGGSTGSLHGNPVVQDLRELCEQVETIKAERGAMENDIKETKCDMSSKFISALAADGAISEESLSGAELERVYAPLTAQVTDSLNRQETLLAQIQTSNTEFTQSKSSNQGAAERDQLLKDLASGFDSFMELKNNLEEGTKFYNELTPLLVRLQSKINDFCFARKTEKEELIADLQKQTSTTPTPSPRSTTAAAAGGVEERKVPPPRPPPPTLPTSPPSTELGASGSTADEGSREDNRKVPPPRPPPRKPPRSIGAGEQEEATEAAGSAPPTSDSATPSSNQPPTAANSALPSSLNPSAPPSYPAQPPGGQAGQIGQPGGFPGWTPPYPGYPAGGYPMPSMPGGYNPYNPYLHYPHHPPHPYAHGHNPSQGPPQPGAMQGHGSPSPPQPGPMQGHPGQSPPQPGAMPYGHPPPGTAPYPVAPQGYPSPPHPPYPGYQYPGAPPPYPQQQPYQQ